MKNRIIALAASLPVATLGFAGIALADNTDTGNTNVSNHNSAFVWNTVSTGANTGGNSSNGGNGGNAGNGGSVSNSDDDNTGGNAGAGGNGGNGGVIYTGDAYAGSSVTNVVNSNDTKINRNNCGCEGDNDINGNDRVKNKNHAFVGNGVSTGADTGYNHTDGGNGGKAGNAGSVNNSDDDNKGGNTGKGGNGGHGGYMETGWSTSASTVVNLVNTNITRIRR